MVSLGRLLSITLSSILAVVIGIATNIVTSLMQVPSTHTWIFWLLLVAALAFNIGLSLQAGPQAVNNQHHIQVSEVNTVNSSRTVTHIQAENASFWTRLIACFLDYFIIIILSALAALVMALLFTIIHSALDWTWIEAISQNGQEVPLWVIFAAYLSWIGILMVIAGHYIVYWLYHIFFEASPARGTIGKQIMGIFVVDEYGRTLSLGQANLRFWYKHILFVLICLCLYIPLVIFPFLKRHPQDRLSYTYVLRQ